MLCLHNARVVLPDERMPGYVLVEDGRLFDVCEGTPRSLPERTQRPDVRVRGVMIGTKGTAGLFPGTKGGVR